MTATTILQEAEVELWEAVEYYEARSPGLGLDFQAEIEASVATISQSPDRWPVRDDGTRRYLTHRFPYVVVYVRLADHIWIIAFAHCRRRPQY
jgi:toxin ParE1/3/4